MALRQQDHQGRCWQQLLGGLTALAAGVVVPFSTLLAAQPDLNQAVRQQIQIQRLERQQLQRQIFDYQHQQRLQQNQLQQQIQFQQQQVRQRQQLQQQTTECRQQLQQSQGQLQPACQRILQPLLRPGVGRDQLPQGIE